MLNILILFYIIERQFLKKIEVIRELIIRYKLSSSYIFNFQLLSSLYNNYFN